MIEVKEHTIEIDGEVYQKTHLERILGLPFGEIDRIFAEHHTLAALLKVLAHQPGIIRVFESRFDEKVIEEVNKATGENNT